MKKNQRPVPLAPTLRTTADTMQYTRIVPREKFDVGHTDNLSPTPLPKASRRKMVFGYDRTKYDLRGAIENLLSQLDPDLIGDWKDEEKLLENFSVPCRSLQPNRIKKSNGENGRAQEALSRATSSDEIFLTLFDEFIKLCVVPWLRNHLVQDGTIDGDNDETVFYYQRPPTLRIQPGPSGRYVRPHNDADYGHQDGELNFWMPLTDPKLTQTELWVESAPGKDDWAPLDVAFGEVATFHGTSCKHYAPANASAKTRVSLDFRIGIGGYFDPNWQMRGKLLHKARCIKVN